MEGEIVLLGEMKDPDQVDRIALEHIRLGDVDAVVVDDEIVGFGEERRPDFGLKRAIMRPERVRDLVWLASSAAHRMAVRSPTFFAVRK